MYLFCSLGCGCCVYGSSHLSCLDGLINEKCVRRRRKEEERSSAERRSWKISFRWHSTQPSFEARELLREPRKMNGEIIGLSGFRMRGERNVDTCEMLMDKRTRERFTDLLFVSRLLALLLVFLLLLLLASSSRPDHHLSFGWRRQ